MLYSKKLFRFFIKTEERRKSDNRREARNNRKFNDKPERFVQSSGIFSEGIGSDVLKKARYERIYSARDDASSAMAIPKVKKDEWQVVN